MSLYLVKTVNGHLLPEVVSAFQKAIRRGEVDDALYWGIDMFLTGYQEYAWKRMFVIASEDIGPIGNRSLPAILQALYQTYNYLAKKKDKAHTPEKLQFVHAIILLAMSPKNRIVDHALIHHFENHAALKRDVPDYALCKHTIKGRRLGRGFEHFFAEAGLLNNEDGEDPYKQLAIDTLMKKEAGAQGKGKPAPRDNLFEGEGDGEGDGEGIEEDAAAMAS